MIFQWYRNYSNRNEDIFYKFSTSDDIYSLFLEYHCDCIFCHTCEHVNLVIDLYVDISPCLLYIILELIMTPITQQIILFLFDLILRQIS